MGDGEKDVRLLVAPDKGTREGRTLLINPATLEVPILGDTLPEEERVRDLRAVGDRFVTRSRNVVKYYSAKDFQLVKKIDDLRPIAAGSPAAMRPSPTARCSMPWMIGQCSSRRSART